MRDYLDADMRLLWVIYPDAGCAMVHRPDGSARMVRETEVLEGEDVLPGFQLRLDELFQAMPGAGFTSPDAVYFTFGPASTLHLDRFGGRIH